MTSGNDEGTRCARCTSEAKRLRGLARLAAAAALAAALLAVPLAAAAGGDLDRAVGEGGTVRTSFDAFAYARALAVQPDGKLLAAGGAGDGGAVRVVALARYLPDGRPDPGFGDGGRVVAELRGFAVDVAVQRDGRILLGVGNDRLVRLEASGRLDASFGGDGVVQTGFAGAPGLQVLARPDGSIVAVGGGGGPDRLAFALARFRADGTLDRGFGREGRVTSELTAAPMGAAAAPGGRIVVLGSSGPTGGERELVLERYVADGRPDPAFGRGGVVRHRLLPDERVTGALAVQPDGGVVVGGGASGSRRQAALLWRFRRDGVLDRSFGTRGTAASGLPYEAGALAVDSGGRIVVASMDFDHRRFVIARFTREGRADPRFGRAGAVTTAFAASDRPRPFAVALQPDRKIVVAGGAGPGGWFVAPRDFALARYLPPRCAVPALRLRTRAAAAQALRQAGCRLGTVRTTHSAAVPRGRVVSQRPAARASVLEDTQVAIVISRGPR